MSYLLISSVAAPLAPRPVAPPAEATAALAAVRPLAARTAPLGGRRDMGSPADAEPLEITVHEPGYVSLRHVSQRSVPDGHDPPDLRRSGILEQPHHMRSGEPAAAELQCHLARLTGQQAHLVRRPTEHDGEQAREFIGLALLDPFAGDLAPQVKALGIDSLQALQQSGQLAALHLIRGRLTADRDAAADRPREPK